jgi:hypothetical protein
MTSSGAPSLDDNDIRAFGAQEAVSPLVSPPPRKRRRLWPWLVLAAALLAVIGAVVLAVNLVGLASSGVDGWHVIVDDETVFEGIGNTFGAVLAVGITAIVLLCVGGVLALLAPFVLVAVLGALAFAIGLPLILLMVLLALLLSPLWLPVAVLVWWLSRAK